MSHATMVESIDPEALRAAIVADVVEAITPLLAESTDPLAVGPGEMARRLSISRPTLDRLRAAGVIPSVMAGPTERCRRYVPADVLAALTAASTPTNDARRAELLSQLLAACDDDDQRSRVRYAMGVDS
ncbi:MerR family transcriptional regulator [Neorhodopirellula pilleata]|uniref:Helix-turn-helix domain protein n=1 Tax=Neorhodopirellula pilleata TaxID=2714738 RepID=A0A5C5ZLQ1_9BACT|nr:helix-turn-helix domain-containing protein [Neorhodopirellula pilleata]TWT88006.1 hypothetical protein Pla100_57360 [Neorhodopirellula pilleata]